MTFPKPAQPEDLEKILTRFTQNMIADGLDGPAAAERFQRAYDGYFAEQEARRAAIASTEEGKLRERIEQEAGILVFGKRDGSKSDYNLVAQKRLTELARKKSSDIALDPYITMGGSVADAEVLSFLHDPSLRTYQEGTYLLNTPKLSDLVEQASSVPVSYVHFSTYTTARDAYGREFGMTWKIITPRDLAVDVVAYCRTHPEKVFDFFNTLVEEPRYSPKKALRGKLYIIDANQISLNEKKTRYFRGLPKPNGSFCELITYPLEK